MSLTLCKDDDSNTHTHTHTHAPTRGTIESGVESPHTVHAVFSILHIEQGHYPVDEIIY